MRYGFTKCLKPQRRDRVTALLAQANLSGMARQPARTLSGGEQQKLAIVRALANQPDVLFLDEPTSSLDPQSCRDIETLIAQTAQSGTKVIMVTHDIGSAQRNAQDIIFIDKGKVSELTPCKQFFAAPQSERARIISGQPVGVMKKFWVLCLLVLLGVPAQSADRFIILQSTTSTRNSGLLDAILPDFQASSGIEVPGCCSGYRTGH